jgi:hypothetical protein
MSRVIAAATAWQLAGVAMVAAVGQFTAMKAGLSAEQ